MNKRQLISFVTAAVFTASVFTGGCRRAATAENAVPPGEETTPVSQWSTLDREAMKHAFDQSGAVWARRGEAWYTINGTGGSDSLMPRSLVEAKGVLFRAQPEPLTEADKLNGVEWRGEVDVTASATRRRPIRSGGGWSDWETGLVLYGIGDGGSTYALEKKRGKWQVVRPAFDSLQLPSSSDLP